MPSKNDLSAKASLATEKTTNLADDVWMVFEPRTLAFEMHFLPTAPQTKALIKGSFTNLLCYRVSNRCVTTKVEKFLSQQKCSSTANSIADCV